MYQAIVDNDMTKSDTAKKVVEDAQRARRTQGTNFDPVHFSINPETKLWEFQHQDIEALFTLEFSLSLLSISSKTGSSTKTETGTESESETETNVGTEETETK